jgi:hypothetical protein
LRIKELLCGITEQDENTSQEQVGQSPSLSAQPVSEPMTGTQQGTPTQPNGTLSPRPLVAQTPSIGGSVMPYSGQGSVPKNPRNMATTVSQRPMIPGTNIHDDGIDVETLAYNRQQPLGGWPKKVAAPIAIEPPNVNAGPGFYVPEIPGAFDLPRGPRSRNI